MVDLLGSDVVDAALREATITDRVKHPAIVQTLEHAVFADDDGIEGENPRASHMAWLVMEFCDRGTLGVR
jgi:serine/threonine protein kinase